MVYKKCKTRIIRLHIRLLLQYLPQTVIFPDPMPALAPTIATQHNGGKIASTKQTIYPLFENTTFIIFSFNAKFMITDLIWIYLQIIFFVLLNIYMCVRVCACVYVNIYIYIYMHACFIMHLWLAHWGTVFDMYNTYTHTIYFLWFCSK